MRYSEVPESPEQIAPLRKGGTDLVPHDPRAADDEAGLQPVGRGSFLLLEALVLNADLD